MKSGRQNSKHIDAMRVPMPELGHIPKPLRPRGPSCQFTFFKMVEKVRALITPSIPLTTPAISADSGRMASERLPDNQEDREVYLRNHRAPSFIEAVSDARRDSLDTVIMTIKAFVGEPEILYVALDYAYHSGMTVTMTPSAERGKPRS
jgi:hypothetical protein